MNFNDQIQLMVTWDLVGRKVVLKENKNKTKQKKTKKQKTEKNYTLILSDKFAQHFYLHDNVSIDEFFLMLKTIQKMIRKNQCIIVIIVRLRNPNKKRIVWKVYWSQNSRKNLLLSPQHPNKQTKKNMDLQERWFIYSNTNA